MFEAGELLMVRCVAILGISVVRVRDHECLFWLGVVLLFGRIQFQPLGSCSFLFFYLCFILFTCIAN